VSVKASVDWPNARCWSSDAFNTPKAGSLIDIGDRHGPGVRLVSRDRELCTSSGRAGDGSFIRCRKLWESSTPTIQDRIHALVMKVALQAVKVALQAGFAGALLALLVGSLAVLIGTWLDSAMPKPSAPSASASAAPIAPLPVSSEGHKWQGAEYRLVAQRIKQGVWASTLEREVLSLPFTSQNDRNAMVDLLDEAGLFSLRTQFCHAHPRFSAVQTCDELLNARSTHTDIEAAWALAKQISNPAVWQSFGEGAFRAGDLTYAMEGLAHGKRADKPVWRCVLRDALDPSTPAARTVTDRATINLFFNWLDQEPSIEYEHLFLHRSRGRLLSKAEDCALAQEQGCFTQKWIWY
jgi:hypothetical protein